MDLPTVQQAATIIGCSFRLCKTGDQRWVRLFILDSRDVTIGRFSFKDGKLEAYKEYKRDYPGFELDNSDRLYASIRCFLAIGEGLPDSVYERLCSQAAINRQEDIERKTLARLAMPAKKRKKIAGIDLRLEMYNLLRRYTDERNRIHAS